MKFPKLNGIDPYKVLSFFLVLLLIDKYSFPAKRSCAMCHLPSLNQHYKCTFHYNLFVKFMNNVERFEQLRLENKATKILNCKLTKNKWYQKECIPCRLGPSDYQKNSKFWWLQAFLGQKICPEKKLENGFLPKIDIAIVGWRRSFKLDLAPAQ